MSPTPITAFHDNYIWLLQSGRFAVVVDPGDAVPVLERLQQQNLTLTAILITHHHHDHTGGIAGILAHYPVPVYGPAQEKIAGMTIPVDEGDSIQLAGIDKIFHVLSIPGHTLGHIAYYTEKEMFCGDTLFAGGCGRVFEGTAEQMHNSLQKIALGSPDQLLYCAHEYTLANLRFAQLVEPNNQKLQERLMETTIQRQQDLPTIPSTLAIEKETNPFLRTHLPAVHQAAEAHAGFTLEDPVQVFRVIREWKNQTGL